MRPVSTHWRGMAVVALLCGCLCVGSAVWGADIDKDKEKDKPSNTDPEKSGDKSAADLSPAAMAAHLAIEGENRKSPLLLLAAAEILADLKQSRREADAVKPEASGQNSDGGLPELDMHALIARARELAKGNAAMEAAVEAMVKTIESDSRGLVYRQGKDLESVVIEGVTYKVINPGFQRIDPGESLTLTNVIFEGGLPAQILVVGDGDGDLDLWVYDGNTGGLIGSDLSTSSVCAVTWTTRYEGPFTVVVKNVGDIYERFYVLANW